MSEPTETPGANETDYSLLDQRLLPIADMMVMLGEVDGMVQDEAWGMGMSIESVEIDLPIELDIMTDDQGKLVLGSAPPTQTVETSFMPVFHRVKVGITIQSNTTHGGE